MTKIMALDQATVTGWALYDTQSPVSAIQCGSIRLDGKTAGEKVHSLRLQLPKLVRSLAPDFVVFESPLGRIIEHSKKKINVFGIEEESRTINAKTVTVLNRIAGAVQMCVEGMNIPCEEVAPVTWITIIPKNIKGGTKDRVRQFCDMFQIIGKNADARDAAVIAIWAAGRSQVLKLEKQAGRAA